MVIKIDEAVIEQLFQLSERVKAAERGALIPFTREELRFICRWSEKFWLLVRGRELRWAHPRRAPAGISPYEVAYLAEALEKAKKAQPQEPVWLTRSELMTVCDYQDDFWDEVLGKDREDSPDAPGNRWPRI